MNPCTNSRATSQALVKSKTTQLWSVPRASELTLADVDEYLTNSRTFNRHEGAATAHVKTL